MFFTIQKNTDNSWTISPNSGAFRGSVIATAEGLDLTSVVVADTHVVGMIKAVWGLQFVAEVDAYSDMETVRALCLGKAFKGSDGMPVSWQIDGIYDATSRKLIRQCRRMVLLGSSIFRRG